MGIVLAILLFGFLILIHELGHFVAAKSFGIQVNEFALFMGPAIWQKEIGETTYSLRCIPIGGYCAMEGEDEESDNPRAFSRASWWKRLIVLVAGAAMNFIAGILLAFLVILPNKELPEPVIAKFTAFSTVNREGGLQVGDRILEVDGEKIYVSSDVSLLLALNPAQTHDLLLERNGQEVFLDDFLMEKNPAVDEEGNPLVDDAGNPMIDEEGNPRILYGMDFSYRDATFLDKVAYSWNTSIDYVRTVRLSLQMLFSGQAGFKDMSGPVGIVQVVSETASSAGSFRNALLSVMSFGALIAVNLAVMNLLPLPALDGGRAVCLLITAAIEGVTKKKINPKYEGYFHAAGMILLLGLMAVITFKDIFMIFKG